MQKNKKFNNITEKLNKILDNTSYNNDDNEDRNLISLKDRLEGKNNDDIFIKKVMVKRISDQKLDLKPGVTIHAREKKIIKTTPVKIIESDTIELKEDASFNDKELFEVEKVRLEESNFIEEKPSSIVDKKEYELEEIKVVDEEQLSEWEPIEIENKEISEDIKPIEEIEKPLDKKEFINEEKIIEWEPVKDKPEEEIKEEFQELEFKPEEETYEQLEPIEVLPKQQIILNEEQEEDIEFKLEPFKDIKNIDKKTAIILYDNGIKSIEELKELDLKELKKIKGIKRKIAKKIIHEIKRKNYDEIQFISEEDISDKVLIDEDKKIKIDETDNINSQNENNKKDNKFFIKPKKTKQLKKSEKENKFKELKTVDEKINKLLIQNGIKTIEELYILSTKDLVKIKGIKRRKAKEIKKEVIDYIKRKKELKDEINGSDKFVSFEPVDFEPEEKVKVELASTNKKISEKKHKKTKGFQYKGYTLFKKEIITKTGKTRTYRFFSKAKHKKADPINIPKGYEIKIDKKTKFPYLKKKE